MPSNQKFSASFEVAKAVSAAQQLTEAFKKQKSAIDAMAKAVTNYNKQYGKFVGGANKTASNMNKVAKSANNAASAMANTGNAAQTATNKVSKGSKKALISWSSLTAKLLAARVLQAIFTNLQGTITNSIKNFNDLSIAISEVQTISQDTFGKMGNNIRPFVKQVESISGAFGLSQLDVVKAQYQAVSNQVEGAADSLSFVEGAAKLATIGLADLEQSVNLLSSALNSYGLSAARTDQLTASFFKTVELGRVRIPEMANDFGRVSSLANQLGVNINEVQAAITTLTRRGVSYAKTQTLITNVLLRGIKPTEDMTATIKSWGYASAEAAIAAEGFGGFIARIDEEVSKAPDKMKEFGEQWSSIRAIIGGSLLGENIDEYNRDLDEIMNATENANEALKKRLESTGETLRRELTQINNFLTNELGGTLANTLKTVNDITEEFGGLSTVVASLTAGLATAGAGYGIAKLIGWIGKLKVAFLAARTAGTAFLGPVGIAITVITVAVTAMTAVWAKQAKQFEELKKAAVDALDEISKKAVTTADLLKNLYNKQVTEALENIAPELQKINKEYEDQKLAFNLLEDAINYGSKVIKTRLILIDDAFKDFTGSMDYSISLQRKWGEEFEKNLKSISDQAKETRNDITSLLDEMEQGNFDRALSRTHPQNRISMLQDRYRGAMNAGDFKEALKILDQIESTADDLASNGMLSGRDAAAAGGAQGQRNLIGNILTQMGITDENNRRIAVARETNAALQQISNDQNIIAANAIALENKLPPELVAGILPFDFRGREIRAQLNELNYAAENGLIGVDEYADRLNYLRGVFDKFNEDFKHRSQELTETMNTRNDAFNQSTSMVRDYMQEMRSLFKDSFDLNSPQGMLDYSQVIAQMFNDLNRISAETGINPVDLVRNYFSQQIYEIQNQLKNFGETMPDSTKDTLTGLLGQYQDMLPLINDQMSAEQALLTIAEQHATTSDRQLKAEQEQAAILEMRKNTNEQIEQSLSAQSELIEKQKLALPAGMDFVKKVEGYKGLLKNNELNLTFAKEVQRAIEQGNGQRAQLAFDQISPYYKEKDEGIALQEAINGLKEVGSSQAELQQGIRDIIMNARVGDQYAYQPIADQLGISLQEFANQTALGNLPTLLNAEQRTANATESTATNLKTLVANGISVNNLPQSSSGGHFAAGGSVDSIPAMLAPGEFVMRSRAVEALGASNLAHMNNLGRLPGKVRGGSIVPGFAEGGMVGAGSNNTFNINATGNHHVDARRLATTIDRERARGTLPKVGRRRRPY